MSVPPDLRVLCRRLGSSKAEDLPRLCPILVGHVLRCGEVLSAPHEARGKDKSSEAALLIHKLKTQINTLLNGKTPAGRFAAVVLVKAVIDSGGWECLQASEPWVRGLLSLLQKPDSLVSKELCIITLVKIFTLLHGYQTLVREIATPMLPTFVSACLQLIKPSAPGRPLRVPATCVLTVVSALATIIPLYPTTLRPSGAQIRSTVGALLAPTSSDLFVIPKALKTASRRLVIALHHTAPKNGSGEEWAKGVSMAIKDCHATADSIFRAVQEYWEPSTGYGRKTVSYDGEPSGGGDLPEELPAWCGLQAGSERLIGLLEFLADHFLCPTRSPVAVPLGDLMDLVSRISLVKPPSPSSGALESSIQLNAAIGREEKDELWSVLPDVHLAALQLTSAITQRLQKGLLPFSSDILDQLVRVFNASGHIPSVREAVYEATTDILLLAGPSLPKNAVDSLIGIIQSCCRDLLRDSGYIQEERAPPATAASKGARAKEGQSNADAFLDPQANSKPCRSTLGENHLTVTRALLTSFLSRLPQNHLGPDSRSLIDRTAILIGSKEAMLASCLHPYRDKMGRYYPSILPFLVQRFPHDQEVKVLRTNLRGANRRPQESWDSQADLHTMLKEPTQELSIVVAEERESTASDQVDDIKEGDGSEVAFGFAIAENKMELDSPPAKSNAFMIKATKSSDSVGDAAAPSGIREEGIPITLKRKASDIDPGSPKKLSKTIEPEIQTARHTGQGDDASDDESDSGSIEIDPTFSDDEDDEDDDQDA